MILYGKGDPIEALHLLAPRVRQVHVKDAAPAREPGAWGMETVVGEGAVPWARFFGVLNERCPGVNLVIERENGETRIADVRVARALIHQHLS
jgi:sugar phosphate isomerase/epimerase